MFRSIYITYRDTLVKIFWSLTGVSNGFHLVNVVVVDDVVERCVKFVEEIHHLVRSAAAGQLGEANNITVDKYLFRKT